MKALKILQIAILAFLIIFVVWPIFKIIKGALFISGVPSLELFKLLLQDQYRLEGLLLSLQLAASVAISSSLLALPLALVLSFKKFIGYQLARAILTIPLIIPPFVGALGTKQILGRFGTINMILLDWGLITSPIDFLAPGSLFGVYLIQTMHLFPLVTLSLEAVFKQFDYSMIEATKPLGISKFTTLTHIVLPLIVPAITGPYLISFVASLTDLGTPLLFEQRVLLPVQIYSLLTETQDTPISLALATTLCIICLAMFYWSKILTPPYTASVGKNFTPIPEKKLGLLSSILFWFIFGILMIIALIPHFGVFLISISNRWFLTPWPENFTLNHYIDLFNHPLPIRSLIISLALASSTVLLALLVSIVTAYFQSKKSTFINRLNSYLLILPLALPGLLFAFGYLEIFTNTILDPFKNPIPLLILAYTAKRSPLLLNTISGSFQNLAKSTEEAALILRATRTQAIWLVVLPQIKLSIIAGASLTFITSILEVSESMLLAVNERYYPVSKALYALQGRPDGAPIACALAVLIVFITTTILLLTNQVIDSNLTDSVTSRTS